MRLIMVKKRLANGQECRKCVQVTQLLKQRGYWDRLDEVIWADETNTHSPGMQLAAQHGMATAPFFLARDGEQDTVYTSALAFMQACFQHEPSVLDRLEEASRTQSDDLGLP